MAELDTPGFDATTSVVIDLTADSDSEGCTGTEDQEVSAVPVFIKQEPTEKKVSDPPKPEGDKTEHVDNEDNITSDHGIKHQKACSATPDEQGSITWDKAAVTFPPHQADTPEALVHTASLQQNERSPGITFADQIADAGPVIQDDDMFFADIDLLRLYTENNANLANHQPPDSASTPVETAPASSGFVTQLWEAAQDEDPEFENLQSKTTFARLKEEYENKKLHGTATPVDDIQYAAAEAAEQSRLGDYERSQMELPDAQDDLPDAEDELTDPQDQTGLPPGYVEADTLFVPEQSEPPEQSETVGQPETPSDPGRKKATTKAKINKQEMLDAMSAGINAGYTKGGKAKRKSAATTDDEPRPKRARNAKGNDGTKPAPRRPRKRLAGTRTMMSNVASLGKTNIVQAAQANAFRPDMPTFTARDKNKALRELIASIPSAERGLHNSDKKAIMDATKKFKGKGVIRSDGQGGWRHRDMESSLYNHQLLGAAFLRDRENSGTKPHGGMVCDEMGFGKTIQMIANILDGKPKEDSPFKTTLIVAPPTLLPQWMSEMDKHVKVNKLGRILRYHSGARLISNDILADLSAYDIILTTYGEVQKSYPVTDPPKHLSSEAKKNEWWAKFYEENVGPLHRIKFHRIVLDEAHIIKNHTSKTSMAVCALTGVFKWCITGTPIMNYIEELYPYFRFLRVPHTGDYATFLHNYCNNRMSREVVNMARIHNILRAIMLRRTHVDTMFNAPVVKLPGITHTTHLVEFNDVERAIYNMVKTRYIFQINNYSRSGELTANYRNILAMMLRLRMLCSHVLLCQDVLKQMLVAADIENLWRLTAKEVQASGDENQKNMIATLRRMLQTKDNTVTTLQTRESVADATTTGTTITQDVDAPEATGQGFALSFKFRKFLRSLSQSKTWTELHLRSICGKCRLPPDDPVCTSCLHVYCKECINAMEYERQAKGDDRCACLECGARFEETSPCSGLKDLGFNSEAVNQKIKRRSRPSSSGHGLNSQVSSGGVDETDEEDKDPDWIELTGSNGTVLPSAKLAATKAAILNWQQTARGEKIIIYTQFLGLCRILDKVCTAEGWGHVLFNGKMSLEAREKAIERFKNDPEIFIMICSLKAGGVGLNLNMASKVIILDLWFNSAIEAQAYCRAFRIGQQRKVEVLRFVVKDSIDEDLIKMQERKDLEVTGAIGPESLGKRATIQQLLELFGEVREENQNEFILIEDEDQVDGDDPNVPMADRLPPRPF